MFIVAYDIDGVILHHAVPPWTPVVQRLSYSPLNPRFAGSNPAVVDGFFRAQNTECNFLRKGSKAVGPVSWIYDK